MSKRMTKRELRDSLGAFNPVGHTVLAFADDAVAADARTALLDVGFADADIISVSAAELSPDLMEMMRTASSAAGFGYEITLMRRYLTLASQGAGWLIVYSPHEAETQKIAVVAKRQDARSAVRYGRLMHEDLV